ncbi:MAG TPA: molybdopterin cofactor-binding domain-containing protein, partial [Gemmatimonadaceae bacterium]|nr:molybdopterin cofactor-binding domain-containing protein [Gemmatimonadaceae bacterium]
MTDVVTREVQPTPEPDKPQSGFRVPHSVVGTPRRKVDAAAKVTGETRFADDLSLPRMLWCKLLRSREPHARIVRIDTSRAEKHPGVIAVLTGRDLPIPFGILPISQDEHALCPDRVRFVGDPVAAVAAIDEDTAADACNLIEVEYEKLPPIESIDDGLKAPESPEAVIHDYGDAGNVHKHIALEFGNVDAEMATADHVREDLFFFEGNTHLPMEQHASLAQWFPDGKVTVWSSTQTPHYLHRALSKVLEMPAAHVRVIATPNGGGFGGKSDPFNHEIVVAALARRTGRPVKIALTREEVFYCHRGRHPTLMRIKTGVKRDGRIVAMDFTSFLDGGAYGSYGVASTYYTGALQTVTYAVPHYRFRGVRVFTNKPPCGPKRGHGTPQPRFGQEVQLDKIAVALGRDPAELRLQQLVPAHSLTANWMRVETIALKQCIERVVDGSGWRSKWQKLPRGRGVGLACGAYLCGAGLPIYWNDLPHSGVQLRLDRSGEVTAFCGATEIGQGSDDVLVACVAEILGVDPLDVRAVTGDTGMTPVDLGSYSSRVTVMMGNAAIDAANKIKLQMAEAAAEQLGVSPERLSFGNGRVFHENQSMTFAQAAGCAEEKFGTLGAVGSYKPPR